MYTAAPRSTKCQVQLVEYLVSRGLMQPQVVASLAVQMSHAFHLQRTAAIIICFHHSRKHASRVLSTVASAQPAATKEGIFSRHGGKMVLGFMGGIGAWFYRSTLGTANFTAIKEKVSKQWPLCLLSSCHMLNQ
jgi:hypothetical protein